MNQIIPLRPQTTAVLSEIELVDRARRGDELAFRTIVQRHNQRLYRLARSVLKDASEAGDVVQESYLRAFAALASFRHESSLATWLTRITVNEAVGRNRKQRPTVGLEQIDGDGPEGGQTIPFPNMSTDIDPERSAAQREIRKLLEQSIDTLPEPFRVVFVMRDVEEMSIEETATALAIRPETVKTPLHRARRLLRRSLDDHLASTLKGHSPLPEQGARASNRMGFRQP